MQKIIIDTNVLVSALIQRSYPFFIVDNAFLDKNIQWCISDPILAEYHAVLSRPKFSKYPGFIASAESLLAHIELLAIKYVPSISINIIDDPDDNKFIELAHECGADFLITGNMNDFLITNYQQTRILTPKEYWEQFIVK